MLKWSEGSKNVLIALRGRTQPNGTIGIEDALRAIIFGTPPDGSVLNRALRDRAVWPQLDSFVQGQMSGGSVSGFSTHSIEIAAEEVAKKEGGRLVGERHLARVMFASPNSVERYAISRADLLKTVDRLELGEAFAPEEIEGRWHGMVDANIILQFHGLDEIDWKFEAQTKEPVTLWIAGTLLNELDRLSYEGGTRRVRDRSRGSSRS